MIFTATPLRVVEAADAKGAKEKIILRGPQRVSGFLRR
jgi:hypothetical protein